MEYSAVACPGLRAVTCAGCSLEKHRVKSCAARRRAPSTRTSKHSGPPRETRNRNILAAGGCEIRVNGVDYRADQPQFVDGPEATAIVRQAFGPVERAMFRVLGIRQYLLLRRAAS